MADYRPGNHASGGASSPHAPHAPIVLVAEDPFVARFMRTVFEAAGCQVEIATESCAAERLRNGELHPDLLVTNHPRLFLLMADRIAILYTAAMPDPDLAACFPRCRMLRKPFRGEQLIEALNALVP